ncbi:MAG: metal ABC transporter substrate-binding protein [Clostridiales bacterium]|nr:metal ABC transporter substrate-binding protein [Clostridiales bacterium]
MNMFKKIKYACAAVLPMFLAACSSSYQDDSSIKAVASFYPMYIIAENVIGDIAGISLENMAQPQTGCLHDYQLTSGDMRKLDAADLFIINGGGMESFLDNALSLFPEMNIIDTSDGTVQLEEEEAHDHGNDDGHEINPHFWLYPENAAVQAQNICDALSEIYPEGADEFQANTDKFIEDISNVETFDGDGVKACIFNEAFEYLSLSYGLDVRLCIEMDENETPSAKELAEIIDAVNDEEISLLIAADDASKAIADTIARETDAEVIVLDPVLTGDYSPSRYVEALNSNARILKGSVDK